MPAMKIKGVIRVRKSGSQTKMNGVKQKVCLIVIDGWGISSESYGNAILAAKTPVMDRLIDANSTEIEAHGQHVGLPDGLMGNSEVGHLNIGAGRVIVQDIDRINNATSKDLLKTNDVYVNACNNAKAKSGRLHLMGLVSDGGVHSHIDHLLGLIKAAKSLGVPKLYVHFFSDGRDTSPTSGGQLSSLSLNFVKQLQDFLKFENYGELVLIVGRYYAMDRDKRWERVKIAYEAIVGARGDRVSADKVIESQAYRKILINGRHDRLFRIIFCRENKLYHKFLIRILCFFTTIFYSFIKSDRYSKDETDEFLKPIIINEEGCLKINDTIVFFDYRSDRMRQIVETIGLKRNFETEVPLPEGLNISCMTQYKKEYPFPLLFPPQLHKNVLAEWISSHKLSQYHCAGVSTYVRKNHFSKQRLNFNKNFLISTLEFLHLETEKYPHVTFFFNGGREIQFDNEERYMVPSPKVKTYDLKPEMSCIEVAGKAVSCKLKVLFVGLNQACEPKKMVETIRSGTHPFVMCNFAPPDMVGHTGIYEAAVLACEATVPFISTGTRRFAKSPGLGGRPAALCDVAPTILNEMGLPVPSDMTGKPLLE
uniref:phosphoglycerate mutase (2,3-diphosphoglycerate-independent) n=1 Tax=Romanomermis culicivorax TaxID=13658 RepID=A0A915IMA2_ROMCU